MVNELPVSAILETDTGLVLELVSVIWPVAELPIATDPNGTVLGDTLRVPMLPPVPFVASVFAVIPPQPASAIHPRATIPRRQDEKRILFSPYEASRKNLKVPHESFCLLCSVGPGPMEGLIGNVCMPGQTS